MNANALAVILDAMGDDDDRDDGSPSISKEGQLARITEVYERVKAGNPFKVGDVVTTRRGMNVNGEGSPHIVIATRAPEPIFTDEPGAQSFGMQMDMRVLTVRQDSIVAFWVESWQFEPYTAA